MFRNYLSAAARNLRRNWVHAAINLLGLTAGLAAALLIALFVRGEYSYDRFIPGYRDVYLVTESKDLIDRRLRTEQWDFSSPDLATNLSAHFTQIQTAARIIPADSPPHIRRGPVEADETEFLWVDPSFFDVVPLPSLAGDLRTALTTPDTVVLTRSASRKYFGRDTSLGEVMEVNPAMAPEAAAVSTAFSTPHPMRVAAVIEDLPSNSYIKGEIFASSLAAYSPFALYNLTSDQGPFRANAYTFIRLRPHASEKQMQQELSAFAARNSTVYPPGFIIGLHLTPIGALHLSPFGESPLSPRGDRTLLTALIAIAMLVVASASFNFVALMTARATQRAVETGIRKAVGALRSQLIVQFLGEAIIFVSLAMVLAVVLAKGSLPYVNSALNQKIAFNLFGDPVLFGALVVITLALGLLAGAYPAFVLSAFRPAAVLKGTLVQGPTAGSVRRALVALQFAFMIGLAIAAVTIWRQTLFSLKNQLRVDGSGILLIEDACTPSGRAFRDRLATIPGVSAQVCTNEAALFNGGMIVSAQVQGGAESPLLSGVVDYGALEFYGLRPVAGRFFDRNHGADGALVEGNSAGNPSIVLNEMAVRKLGFRSASEAIGKTVTWNRRRWSANPTPGTIGASEVIGVAPDLTLNTRRPAWAQVLYVDPVAFDTLSVRLIGSQVPEALSAIDAAWSATMQTSIHRRFLSKRLQELYADVILQGTAISLGAGLAGLIAALGLFGLSARSAEERTKEIGIRKALGGSRVDILRMLLWQFALPILWANVLAWPLAYFFVRRWLDGFTSHVDMNPLIFLAISSLALVIALATVSGHALLVARAKPVEALRYE
jgi:putative ABC transport system permease protein